jgi:hypothetical protein
MKKSGLIDMFGLSSDPISNDQLDDLLFRLESDGHLAHEGGSDNSFSPSVVVVTASGYDSNNILFNTSNEGKRTIRLASYPTLQ